MTEAPDPLSQTQILAAASEVLISHQFSEVPQFLSGVNVVHRIFEDAYSVVAVVVFADWNELKNGWIEVQSALVETMTESVPKEAPKSWDGYLVLFTKGLIPSDEDHQLSSQIRYDTGRVRKLIATGDVLSDVSDVESALLPLLPLREEMKETSGDGVLGRLPELLEKPGLPSALIRAVVDAFVSHESLLEVIHKQGGGQ